MSNRIDYTIGRCSKGESFNLSGSLGNDVSGNLIGFTNTFCTRQPEPDPLVTLSFVSRSASPSIIGFNEFVDPSSPPRKYLKKTGEGVFNRCNRNGSCSGTIASSNSTQLSGYDSYNVSTGALELHSLTTLYRAIGSCDPIALDRTVVGLPAILEGNTYEYEIHTSTKTTSRRDSGICSINEGWEYSQPSGYLLMTLMEEDTEDAAITRAGFSIGNEMVAYRTARTSGFSFSLVYVTPTAHCSNLLEGIRYSMTRTIRKVNLTSGSVSTYTDMSLFDATSSSMSVALDEIRPESGFSCEIINCTISRF